MNGVAVRRRRLPPDLLSDGWWRTPVMLVALAEHDLAAVFRHLSLRHGLTMRGIADRIGLSLPQITAILTTAPTGLSYDLLVRVADGLRIPRGHLGLAYSTRTPDGSPDRDCPQCTVRLPEPPTRWTGREARLLRLAAQLSVRAFAAKVGVSDRMVSKWEAGGAGLVPRPVNQRHLQVMFDRLDAGSRSLYGRLQAESASERREEPTDPGPRLAQTAVPCGPAARHPGSPTGDPTAARPAPAGGHAG
jgi:transcriptional regulator with XRE-family HTH domain